MSKKHRSFSPTPDLVEKYKFNWNKQHIKYLGVHLPNDLSSLFKINYGDIIKKIYKDMERWALLPLDIGDRIRSVKVVILPKLLYLFIALPVDVSLKQFRELDTHICRFI